MDISLVLLAPEIPGNTGSVGRLCVCLDCPLHLIRPLGFDISEAAVRRAGLDYWQHVDLHVHDDWDAFLAAVAPRRLIFASSRGTRSYLDHAFQPGDTVVFGRETSGLPPDFYSRYAADLVTIPMPGEHRRSLNLANAVSIIAYEAYRQLEHAPRHLPPAPSP